MKEGWEYRKTPTWEVIFPVTALVVGIGLGESEGLQVDESSETSE